MTGGGLPVAAVVAAALTAIAAAFQAALAAGLPWAGAAYGGRAALPDGRLRPRHRVSSAAAALVLLAIGWLLLLRGGVLGGVERSGPLTVACWAFAVLFALNTLGNLTGRSPVERWGMGAVTAALTVLCVLLALG